MINRWVPFLNNQKIILASGSPRRKELLCDLGIRFIVKTSDFPENLSKENISPSSYVEQTCMNKFNFFLENNKNITYDILITADSIVEYNNQIIEKPKNKEQCIEWFKMYSNNKVLAHTYMVIGIIDSMHNCVKMEKFLTTTNVVFDSLSDEAIEDYASTSEPYDKAGGFGIQGIAKSLIKGIEGDYYNVVGFPVNAFSNHLVKMISEYYGKEAYKTY